MKRNLARRFRTLQIESLEHKRLLTTVPTIDFGGGATEIQGALRSVAADFNGDGNDDLAVIANGSVFPLLSTGVRQGFTIGNALLLPQLFPQFFPQLIQAGDIDGDSDVDLIISDGNQGSTFSTSINDGHGNFSLGQTFTLNPQYMAESISVADFNRDGKMDVLFSGTSDPFITSGFISVAFSNASGTLDAPVDIVVLSNGTGLDSAPAVADFNGDGLPDIAFAADSHLGSLSPVFVLPNHGATFGDPLSFNIQNSFAGPIAAGDFDGDGRIDLAVRSLYSGTPAVLLLTNWTPSPGNDPFFVVDPWNVSPALGQVTNLVVGDFNNDARLDLAGGTYNGDTLLYANSLDGQLMEDGTLTGFQALQAADFNGDHRTDLVGFENGFGFPVTSVRYQRSASTAISFVSQGVIEMSENGLLTASQAHSLQVKLDAAQDAVRRENDQAVAGLIGSVIQQIEAIIRKKSTDTETAGLLASLEAELSAALELV